MLIHFCSKPVTPLLIQAFVQACFILVETLDNDNISKAGEGAPFEEQAIRFFRVKIQSAASCATFRSSGDALSKIETPQKTCPLFLLSAYPSPT